MFFCVLLETMMEKHRQRIILCTIALWRNVNSRRIDVITDALPFQLRMLFRQFMVNC